METTSNRMNTTLANDGRNEIRINNSAGRCMLENWVEEVSLINKFINIIVIVL